MIKRNRGVYGKLSVTVVLSFSLLFAFLSFTDARLYNQYKEVFAQPREIVLSNVYGKPASFQALISQIKSNTNNADCYGYTTHNGICEYENGDINARCSFLPNGDIPVYTWKRINIDKNNDIYSVTPVKLIGEKKGFDLKGNEIIINKSWYEALINGGVETPIQIPIHFDWQDGKSSDWILTVVGICSDTERDKLQINELGYVYGWGNMYLPIELLSRTDVGEFGVSTEYSVWTNTPYPEKVIAYARALGFSTYGASEAQQAANTILKVETTNKSYIAAVMLVLLSINLYSSFSNALKDRQYEIGVKRALGAEKRHIVRQYLYESASVLLLDTLISITLVVNLMIGYKVYQLFFLRNEWTIYVSIYSIIIFLICSLSLSIVFSLIFAFQSTQVKIISNIRNE